MQKNKKQKRTRSTNNSFFMCVLKGASAGLISFVIALALSSLIVINSNITTNSFYIIVLIASALAAVLCAIITALSSAKNRLVTGMVAVIIITLIQFLILLCFNNADLSVKIYYMFPIDVAAGFLGCIAGSNIRR